MHATLEPAVISGDPLLAECLIANLVDNAVRYNHAGGDIWISTRTIAGSTQLTAANTGPVISEADADRIFQPSSGSATARPMTVSGSAWPSSRSTAAPPPPAPRDHGGLTVTVTIPSAGAPAQGTGLQAANDQVFHAQVDAYPFHGRCLFCGHKG